MIRGPAGRPGRARPAGFLAVAALILLAASSGARAAGETPVVLYHPFGISGRLADAFLGNMARLGAGAEVVFQPRPIPFARLEEALTEASGAACVAPIGRATAERHGLRWLSAGIVGRLTFYARPGLDVTLNDPREARAYRVGTVLNGPTQDILSGYGIKTEGVTEVHMNLRKLMDGRIDFWVAFDIVAAPVIAETGIGQPRIALRSPPYEFGLACRDEIPAPVLAALVRSATAYGAQIGGRWFDAP